MSESICIVEQWLLRRFTIRGQTVPQVAKKIGVTEQTYYRWRKEFGGLRTDQAKRFKELKQENARLKRLLADA